jgi:hypothetical protein
VIDRRTYSFFPASSLGTMHACNSTNSFPPLRTRTCLIFYYSMSIILTFRRLWTIPIWILFCYKRWASLSSLWKISIDFWPRNHRPWACSSMFISIFLFEIFLAFKTLANSYSGFKDHKFFSQVDNIFQSGASLSPAEISKLMIVNRNSPS